jgi:nucleotide-binding universal stress UspA family protein
VIRSVLVPLDGSHFAESALPVALDLARKARASLRLVMAHDPAMALVTSDAPGAWTGLDEPDLREQEREYLAGLAGDIRIHGETIEYELIDGRPGPALAEKITLAAPDLVVMASHGRGSFSRFWLGSVTDYVVRHVPVPVLLLRPLNGVGRASAGFGCRNILVALDLSKESESILKPVKALARLSQGRLTLTYVVEPAGHMLSPSLRSASDPARLESERLEAQERLEAVATGLRSEGFDVATRVIVGSGVAAELLDLFQKGHFDLMALTTHGTGGLQRAILGSVADKVLRGAEKPVLMIRPSGSVS